ncbi:Kinesin, putative [Hondaea fermentalgiana]|uniref:Kinesin-like protein n=1 Tax=Hondaea fermentalgiana TaxID=2315210 RepID=A0A2R5GGQ2_9STRA|nr:Kinesin, putative [Hondaea fermentalgiana]|eukprot:GBG28938.1 Kinesin, putative [Hondaea fermentalgiana]
MTLRGNMRVFCRLRPGTGADAFNAQTGTVGDLRVRAPASKTVDGRDEAAKVLHFKFDYVFPDDARQCDVFDEVQGLVQSALDGHNVCIFAYGQTGSGKTHTMSNHTGADPGIIPRALELILREHSQKPRLSLLEIYNEELRDLLAPVSADSQGKRSRNAGKRKAASSAAAPKLRIRIDPKRGKPQLQGLSEVAISSAAHARDLLQRAEDSRMVARTNANERSSRSHVVLTLALDHADSNTTSSIHLVDLAGSERIAHAGSDRSAKQLKEQCSINTSLVALKNALRALATQQTHIPFRDSKLTYLLQDALESQTCKTLMLCNLSQDSENIPESLNTLRFASQVLQN